VISTIFTKSVVGGEVTLSLFFLMWVCLALGVQAPSGVVKNSIDEVIRGVTDENVKVPEQASHRRQLLEDTIGKQFDFEEIENLLWPRIGKAGMQVSIKNLLPCF